MQGHGRPGRPGVLIQNAVEDLLVGIDRRGQQLLAGDIGDGDHRCVDNRHQRLYHHVVGAFRKIPVKPHILDQVILPRLNPSPHSIAVLRQPLGLLCAVPGSQLRDRRFQHQPHVRQVQRQLNPVLNGVQAQRIGFQRHQRCHIGTGAVLDPQNSTGYQQLHRFPDRSPADAEPVRQLIFIGQLCAHRQTFIQNILEKMVLNTLCQRLVFNIGQPCHNSLLLEKGSTRAFCFPCILPYSYRENKEKFNGQFTVLHLEYGDLSAGASSGAQGIHRRRCGVSHGSRLCTTASARKNGRQFDCRPGSSICLPSS